MTFIERSSFHWDGEEVQLLGGVVGEHSFHLTRERKCVVGAWDWLQIMNVDYALLAVDQWIIVGSCLVRRGTRLLVNLDYLISTLTEPLCRCGVGRFPAFCFQEICLQDWFQVSFHSAYSDKQGFKQISSESVYF